MKRITVVTLAIAVSLAAPLVWAKGHTVKLTVRSENLASAVDISDSRIVSSFSIWNGPGVGPGVNLNGDRDLDNPGKAFIDWPTGILSDKPAELDRYEVTFHIADGRHRAQYTVVYEFDASTSGGYIYLPGLNDSNPSFNWGLIRHGVEGNWFHSSSLWERLVRPVIEAAQDLE